MEPDKMKLSREYIPDECFLSALWLIRTYYGESAKHDYLEKLVGMVRGARSNFYGSAHGKDATWNPNMPYTGVGALRHIVESCEDFIEPGDTTFLLELDKIIQWGMENKKGV